MKHLHLFWDLNLLPPFYLMEVFSFVFNASNHLFFSGLLNPLLLHGSFLARTPLRTFIVILAGFASTFLGYLLPLSIGSG